MRDLAELAERLRLVRRARRKFLKLWAIERALVEPGVERLAADLVGADLPDVPGPAKGLHGTPPAADKA